MELFYPWTLINEAHDDERIVDQRNHVREEFREKEQEYMVLYSDIEPCLTPSGWALHAVVCERLGQLRGSVLWAFKFLEWESKPETLVDALNTAVIGTMGTFRVMTDRHATFIGDLMQSRITERLECFLEELSRMVSERCAGSAMVGYIHWAGSSFILMPPRTD